MSVLDLAACPICQARDGLARQTTRVEGRAQITYECLRCGSVLLWLGDDLWLEADRWAYQSIGRPEMAHLLHEAMTADELRRLADPKRAAPYSQPPPVPEAEEWPPYREAVILSNREWSGQPPESGGWEEPVVAPLTTEEDLWDEEPYEEQPSLDTTPMQAPAAPQAPVRRRRSRGSPFLAVSVVLTMLCLLCASVVMIASSTLGPGAEQPTQQANPLPTQVASTDTPLPTEPPIAVETVLPVPTEVPALLFQGVTDYVASTGSHYVVGEVLNTTGDNLRFVEVMAFFYDGSGQLVGTGSTFTEISTVEAGTAAPFKLATLDPPPSLASHKLRADYQTTSQSPLRLEILEHRSFIANNGWYHIVGQVRNPHEFPVKFPEIVATYYNPSLEVLRVEIAFSDQDTLQPGQTSPFEVVLVDPPADLHEYALQTEAVPE